MDIEKYVKKGDKIVVQFIGKLEDGSIFDLSTSNEPLKFRVGQGEVIEGFDDAVIGMKINQEKDIYINSDKAYGPVEKELVISIKKEKLPDDLKVHVGQQLQIPGEDGNSILVRVTKISEKTIELDGNHPVAGKNLIFNIKLVDIE